MSLHQANLGSVVTAISPLRSDWATTITALATAATAAIFLLAALFAGRQARQARLLREAQFRPFVIVDFDTQTERPLILLRIANIGSTMARNVTFDINPPFSSTFDGDRHPDVPDFKDLSVFNLGIPTLPPGKSITTLFDSAIQRRPPYPDTYSIRVTYDGERRNTYTDEMTLDLGVYKGFTYVHRRTIHDIHERLKEMGNEMRKWRASFGPGLLAVSPRDVKERQDQWMRQHQARDDEEGP